MKLIWTFLLALALAGGVCRGGLYSYDFNSGFANGGVVADGNVTGWSDSRTINDITGDDTILDVNVRLNLSGGYNGDLYGYLVHDSGFAILLNRVGKTTGDAFGYGNAGFNITLDGQAGTYDRDVHLYNAATPGPTFSAGKLTGTWQEDGRNVNPLAVLDSDSRTALLSSFNGGAGNGNWTLFLADFAAGDQSTVVSWGLDITVVPEPVSWALAAFAGGGGIYLLVRRQLRQPAGCLLLWR